MVVKASGTAKDDQSLYLGNYRQIANYNGHAAYELEGQDQLYIYYYSSVVSTSRYCKTDQQSCIQVIFIQPSECHSVWKNEKFSIGEKKFVKSTISNFFSETIAFTKFLRKKYEK